MPEFPKQISRVASVISLMASLIWLQWPLSIENFSIGSLLLFLGSLITWISIEAADFSRKKSNDRENSLITNDVQKVNVLIGMIDEKQYYILKNHDIETYIGSNDYKGLTDLIAYKEIDIFEFHNIKLKELYIKLCDYSEDFIYELFRLYTVDGNDRATWRPSGGQYVSQERYIEVQREISELRKKKRKVQHVWEDIISVARKDLIGSDSRVRMYEFK